MKDSKINTNKLHINKFVYLTVFFLFVIFIVTLCYRGLVDYKANDKLTISEFIKARNILEDTIMPERGTIYDVNGNPLAQDVSSYTLIAYLDERRSENSETLRHVFDKEMTAKALSEHIDTSYERILELLNKDAYQVEFGTGGKNLSQLKMEEIKNLNLPGIDFIKSTKRYYPNGDFASYLLGYTKKREVDGNSVMVGELGIEGYYNKELTGKTGYITYERDARGNKIANSNEYVQEAVNGENIYLTIDSNIQLFIEKAVKNAQEESQAEWVLMGVMDAKTGAILGYSSTPSFDPNIRNITNYLDPLVSYSYEPGSTMKTFSYMCAVDSGKYRGSDTFLSGSKTYVSQKNENDTVTIKDWNGIGWGTISYDYGFAMSSNIGVANMLENFITKQELSACYDDYGFGKKTGMTLNNELQGDIGFNYDVEAATAGYGQGIMVTPIQILQGLTIIANDGAMVKPYIVSKIVDGSGKITFEGTKSVSEKKVSTETVDKMKELMRSVISIDATTGTGYAYYMDGYDLIGKTGTASIYENGKYLTGEGQYIYSFSGLYPGDDPEIIMYIAIKKPKDSRNYMASAVKDVLVNTANYLNISYDTTTNKSIKIDNYLNKVVTEVRKDLEDDEVRVITLGDGKRIIKQYPDSGTSINKNDLVILLTDSYDKTMVDFTGLSYKESLAVLEMMGVAYKLEGYGYAYFQNILVNEKIEQEVEIKFRGLY